MTLRPSVLLLSSACVALAYWLGIGTGRHDAARERAGAQPQGASADHADDAVGDGPNAPARAAATTDVDVRVRVIETVRKEVEPLAAAPELAGYLDDLEARARRQGQVSALEVEPGLMAIEKLLAASGPTAVADAQSRFGERMAALSRELRAVDPGDERAADLSALLRAIEGADEGADRQAKIRAYVEGAMREPVAEQVQALAKLDALVASERSESSDPSLHALLEAVQAAGSTAARRPLVQRYLDAAGRLEPDRAQVALRDLDAVLSR